MKETIDQKIISKFSIDALEFYDELIWLYHSLDPEKVEFKESELFRNRIHDKFALLVADYLELKDRNLINQNTLDVELYRKQAKEYINSLENKNSNSS